MRLNPHFAVMPHRVAISFGLPAAYFGDFRSADELGQLLRRHGHGRMPSASDLANYLFLREDALDTNAYVLAAIDGRRQQALGGWSPPARWFSRCAGVVDGKLAYHYKRGEVPAPGGDLCLLPANRIWEPMGSRLQRHGCVSNPWMLVHYPDGHPEVPAYAHPDYQWENSL